MAYGQEQLQGYMSVTVSTEICKYCGERGEVVFQ